MHFTLAYKIVHEPKFNWDETNLEFYFIRSNVKHSQIGYNVFNSIFCKPNDYYAHTKKKMEKNCSWNSLYSCMSLHGILFGMHLLGYWGNENG